MTERALDERSERERENEDGKGERENDVLSIFVSALLKPRVLVEKSVEQTT